MEKLSGIPGWTRNPSLLCWNLLFNKQSQKHLNWKLKAPNSTEREACEASSGLISTNTQTWVVSMVTGLFLRIFSLLHWSAWKYLSPMIYPFGERCLPFFSSPQSESSQLLEAHGNGRKTKNCPGSTGSTVQSRREETGKLNQFFLPKFSSVKKRFSIAI